MDIFRKDEYEKIKRENRRIYRFCNPFQTLREMTDEEKVREYLDDLTGRDKEIRPVVQAENRTLEIILNSKIQNAKNPVLKSM